MVVSICVGSACHLKGSRDLVELLKNAIEKHNLSEEVTLTGSFCLGECNRNGVTIQVDGEICPGVTVDDEFFSVTPETVDAFFQDNVLAKV